MFSNTQFSKNRENVTVKDEKIQRKEEIEKIDGAGRDTGKNSDYITISQYMRIPVCYRKSTELSVRKLSSSPVWFLMN